MHHKKTSDSRTEFWFILGAIVLFGMSAFGPGLISFVGLSVVDDTTDTTNDTSVNTTLPENISPANISLNITTDVNTSNDTDSNYTDMISTTINTTINTTNTTLDNASNTTTHNINIPDANAELDPDLFIGLMYPSNGSEQESNVTFHYDLNSIENIEQCSLYTLYRYIDTDFRIASTDLTPVIAENTFTLTDLIDGEYFWKIGCSDDYDEVFSNTWTFFVGDSELAYRNTSPPNLTTNLSDITINTSNITGLSSDSIQGIARLGEPVNWTRRILLNHTGPPTGSVVVRTYLPESAKDIEVFETPLDNVPDKGLVLSSEVSRRRIDVSKIDIGEPIFLTLDDSGATVQKTVQSPTSAIIFQVTDNRKGLFNRLTRWLSTMLGITGAATLYDYPVLPGYPENSTEVGRNFNIIYNTDREFDMCSLFLNSLKEQDDILVLEGVNFFEIRDLEPGDFSWQIVCTLNNIESYSPIWYFSSGESLETDEVTENDADENITTPSADNTTQATQSEGLFSLPESSGAFKEVNITDNATTPKLLEIFYTTPPPIASEIIKDQYTKTISINADVNYTNITAFTDVPWVPDWMVKLEGEGTGMNMSEVVMLDSNNDSLIDRIEWVVPYISAQAYTLDLSYDIPEIGLVTNISITEDLVTSLQLEFENNLKENDTLSVEAFSTTTQTLVLIDPASNNTLSKITLQPNTTGTYNLTITYSGMSARYLELRSDKTIIYTNISALDKKVLIPKKIQAIPDSFSLSENIATRHFNTEEIGLIDDNGTMIAGFDVYFGNAEMDIDLSDFRGESDTGKRKAFMHLEGSALVSRERTLYVPSTGEGIIYLCPGARSLDDVQEDCPGMRYIYPGNNPDNNSNIFMEQVMIDNNLFYKVQGVTGTGGGEAIRIINTHSYPSLGENWTVMFETEGTHNLTITPIWNTSFDELQNPNNLTINDLKFWDVKCGEISVKDTARFIDSDNTTHTYSELKNSSANILSIFFEDYDCITRSFFTSEELSGGHHYLRFDFGDQYSIAENYVSLLECTLTSASCAYTDVFHLSSFTNAHAEFANQSNYAWSACCREVYGEMLGTDCASPKAEPILKLEKVTNSHVEKTTESNYEHDLCLSSTENYNITCAYDTDCSGYETCVASISSTETGLDTNLMLGNCTGTDSYTTKICCDSDITPGSGGDCIIPYDGYTVLQNITFCSGTYYLNDSDNDGIINFGGGFNVSCNGTTIIGNGSGYAFEGGIHDFKIDGCTIENYEIGIKSQSNAFTQSGVPYIYNNTISNTVKAIGLNAVGVMFGKGADIYLNKITNATETGIEVTGANAQCDGCKYCYNVNISSNTVNNSGNGMEISCNGGVIFNNTILNTINSSFKKGGGYQTVYNNTFYNQTIGFDANLTKVFYSSEPSALVYYNNFSESRLYHAYAATSYYAFNTTVGNAAQGNFWDEVIDLAIFDTDVDGFGDSGSEYPYNASFTSKVNGNVTDWGPFTSKNCADVDGDGYGAEGTNTSLCNFTLHDCNDNNASIFPPRDNLNLTADTILCNGTFYLNDSDTDGIINLKADNISLQCNSTIIIGNTSGSAFAVSGRSNVSIVSCKASNYTYGIDVTTTDNSTFHSNNISNTTISTILRSSDNNLFYNNRFESSSTLHASSDTDTNHFNRTIGNTAQGNYWSGIDSLKIFDSTGTGFGDIGIQYPYNQSKGGLINPNITDYGPITTRTDYRISAPILATPADHKIITDSRNPLYGWQNPEHTLSDSVTYQIQVDDNSDFGSPIIDKSNITETATFTYYWNSASLEFATTYYWRARANDTFNLSLWSTSRDFSILPTTSCTQPVDEINFGTMTLGQEKDTLTDNPPPYNTENDGNLQIRGKVYSDNLWESGTPAYSVMPNQYYQFMIGEDESSAYTWALDSSWINMTNTSVSAAEALYGFRWENISDSLDIHIKIKVPGDEPPGAKYSTTYITCEQNETY